MTGTLRGSPVRRPTTVRVATPRALSRIASGLARRPVKAGGFRYAMSILSLCESGDRGRHRYRSYLRTRWATDKHAFVHNRRLRHSRPHEGAHSFPTQGRDLGPVTGKQGTRKCPTNQVLPQQASASRAFRTCGVVGWAPCLTVG